VVILDELARLLDQVDPVPAAVIAAAEAAFRKRGHIAKVVIRRSGDVFALSQA
jgi:hypothetical protein